MEAWLEAQNRDRCVRLIQGGPGSGKSSFAKSLAASLASDDNRRPLLIELQRLRGTGLLADRINNLFVDREELFRINPLDKSYLDEHRPLVLIFDGLDELAVPESTGAQTVAEDFWDDLDELLESLNSGTKSRALAIFTGRDAIMEAALGSRRGRKLPPNDALQVVGLHAVNIVGADLEIDGEIDVGDQRTFWWQRFAEATGVDAKPPPVILGQQLETLTDEPLLCYLLAISGKAEESRSREIDNVNEIYDKLIGDVWARVWGPDASSIDELSEKQRIYLRQKGPIAAFRSKSEFEQVLEYVAIAAWRGGESRIATLEAFEEAIRQTSAEDIWAAFESEYESRAGEESFATLALTFFFRKQDVGARGFEFTHRSFGEYLAARCIARQAEGFQERFAQARSVNDLSEWLTLTGGAEITRPIIEFLCNEMRRKSGLALHPLRDALLRITRLVLRDGMPVRLGDKDTWRTGETRQRNAEGALLACLSATSLALITQDKSAGTVNPFVDLEVATARHQFERLGITQPNGHPHGRCLGGLSFRAEQDTSHFGTHFPFFNLNLFATSWVKSDLHHMHFGEARLDNSNLSEADLSSSILKRTELRSVNLSGANLSGADLSESILHFANLSGANLTDADLSDADLMGANLMGANLRGAKLCGAKLMRANLRRANLSSTDLTGAKLADAVLIGAKRLTNKQIDAAHGNSKTKLPRNLKRPKSWKDTDEPGIS